MPRNFQFTREDALKSLRPNVDSYARGIPTEQEITDELLRLQTLPENDRKRRHKELVDKDQDLSERMDDLEERVAALEKRGGRGG